jgi:hypothetical protein
VLPEQVAGRQMMLRRERDNSRGLDKGQRIAKNNYSVGVLGSGRGKSAIEFLGIAQIRRSKFLIADFTCGQTKDHGEHIVRGSVYFEAGFAAGLNLPII